MPEHFNLEQAETAVAAMKLNELKTSLVADLSLGTLDVAHHPIAEIQTQQQNLTTCIDTSCVAREFPERFLKL